MSWVPAEQVIQTVAAQRQVLAQQQARIAGFTQYHDAERAKLVAEHAQATHDLGQALLPSLDPRAIAAAAQVVGLAGLTSEDIPGKLEARRAWLAWRIAEIDREPRFAQRELLRHPRTGSLTRALAEAQENRTPWAGVLSTCEEHERFQRLWESGFGTPEFSAPWWRYSYWEDRAAAARLVLLFEGKTTFAEVRAEYQRARDTVAVFDAEIARLRGEMAAGEVLSREHAALVDEHEHLDERSLEHTRGRIVQHLLTSDASLVSQRLQPWKDLRLLFLRSSGIGAKVTYLDGLQRKNLTELQAELTKQAQRLDGVEQKTRRRWAPMPLDRYQKLAEDRQPRFEKRWQRFGKVYQTVHVYDRWDRGRYYEDLLWWDLMTRGRYDGSYLPDVATFHQSHPDYTYDPDYKSLALADAGVDRADVQEAFDDHDDADAAAAGIEADTDTAGDAADLGGVDAS